MSYNARVTEAAIRCGDAYRKPEYKAVRDEYYKVLAEELVNDKGRVGGWLPYEDPVDTLGEAIFNGDRVEWVAEILEEYIRFHAVVRKVTDIDWYKPELVDAAKRYIKGEKVELA